MSSFLIDFVKWLSIATVIMFSSHMSSSAWAVLSKPIIDLSSALNTSNTRPTWNILIVGNLEGNLLKACQKSVLMISIGIESTAHTFSAGIMEEEKILANVRDMFVPAQGGINPLDAKEHHLRVKEKVLEEALKEAKISLEEIEIVSYAAGPGLPPCLKAGAEFASEISKNKPIIAV